jgi:hypothetical protein
VALLVLVVRVVDHREGVQAVRRGTAHDLRGARCHARRVEAAAHEHTNRSRVHAVSDREAEQARELIDVVPWIGIPEQLAGLQRPVAAHAQIVPLQRIDQTMGGRHTGDIKKCSLRRLRADSEEQKVANRLMAQVAGDGWMLPDATKHTRHDEGAADTRVIQRFHAKVIPGTQQPSVRGVPETA